MSTFKIRVDEDVTTYRTRTFTVEAVSEDAAMQKWYDREDDADFEVVTEETGEDSTCHSITCDFECF